ncbi:MAG: ferritin-like domain-containing protein [Rhodospirillales bacterium]|nr:ferritin-like domain-containing protein [Rhodospirillales bacterium]MDE1883472.1 ferritin-like domain-containing protein [Rhodospirillales bacterium]MDE2458865.1 ferritin-like domain-containing protein [Rhodospirillales bacterium]
MMLEQGAVGENHFLADVQRLRVSAQAMMAGGGEPVRLLQTAMSAEIACVLRYSMIAVSADGLENEWVATECAAQAADEREHMVKLAKRITELGGKPDYFAAGLATRHVAPEASKGCLPRLFAENLAAEQCVIELYRELSTHFASDPKTQALLDNILADEETHTSDLEDLLTTQLI